MPPIRHFNITTITTSIPFTEGDIESPGSFDALPTTSESSNEVEALSINLPMATQTVSVFVTVTQLQTITVSAVMPVENVVSAIPTESDGPKRLNVPSSSTEASGSTATSTSPTTTPSSIASGSSSLSLSQSSLLSSSRSSGIPPPSASSSTRSMPSTKHKPSSIPGVRPPSAAPDQVSYTVSTGAAVGITLACVLFTLLLAVCFIRQRLRRKRINDRKWITPFLEKKPTPRPSVNHRQQKKMEYLTDRWLRMRNSRNRAGVGESSRGNETSSRARVKNRAGNRATARRNHLDDGSVRAQTTLPPPPPSAAHREPSARRPVDDSLIVSSLFPRGAVAKLTFQPIRSDELAVSPGDYLRVIALYDDGWALCRNNYGGKGMVPTTCLRVNDVRRLG